MNTRLTSEQIEKIEELINTFEEEGGRSAIIKFNIPDLIALSGWTRTMRALGISILSHKGQGMSRNDRKAFMEWMREKAKNETKP